MLLKKMLEEGTLKGSLKEVAPGDCLFTSGSANHQLFYLLKGSARLNTASGKEGLVQAGTLLGLPDLMHDTYSLTVTTAEPTEVLCIAKEDLQQALQQNAALRLYLIQQMSSHTLLTATPYE